MNSKANILVKGSILRMFEFFGSAIVSIFLMPFIIRSLGDQKYGLWVFVGSFLGYYGLMDFGLGSAIQRFISRAIGDSDNDKVNKVVNTALFLFTIIGFVSLVASFIIAFALPLFIKNITEITLFRKIILILGLNFAIGFPLRVFSGILSSNLRYDLSTIIELIKLSVRTFLIIVFLRNGYGITALAVITLITDISSYTAKYFIVRHLYKYLVFSFKLFNKPMVRPLFGYSVYTFISQIADQLRFNIDNLVITIFIGLSSVTLYSIASRLVMYFMEFMISAMGMFTPMFSQYEAKNDFHSIRDKLIFTTKITGYLSILIGGIVIMFGRAFIQRWMGQAYLGAYPILIVLMFSLILAFTQSPSTQLLFGISKHKLFAISNSIEGIGNLILSIILVKKYGLIGVALGTAIPMIIIKLFVQPIYTCRVINLSIKNYYIKILMPIILNSAIVLIVCWLLVKNFIFANYLNLVFFISAIIIMFTTSIFFSGFNFSERNYFRKTILSFSKKQL